jgi:hypothetical protein
VFSSKETTFVQSNRKHDYFNSKLKVTFWIKIDVCSVRLNKCSWFDKYRI